MKKYAFRFAIAFLAFVIGTAFASTWFSEFFAARLFVADEISEKSVQIKSFETKEELGFDYDGVVMECGNSPTSKRLIYVSDGTEIYEVTYKLRTQKETYRKFQSLLKKANKIFEDSPILDSRKNKIGKKAIIEIEDQVLIVSFSELKSEYGKSFVMTTITTLSLRHALAFEKEQESFIKSAIIASQIKP